MPDEKDKPQDPDTQIHLPKTDFPMKGNLAQREPEFYEKWENNNLYRKIIDARRGRPNYILHDGPPYANGNIHMGHVMNKVLKDIVVRYKLFKNYYSPYVPGWDCHGMPIEHKVAENLGSKKSTMSKPEIRKHCRDYAMKFVELQKKQFKRMGILGDWEHPYLTLDKEYEDKMVDIFWGMYKKGLVYKGLKPVYWCSDCATALAEAEVEYKDHTTPSVYVKFRICDNSKSKTKIDGNLVIWTTTPWTLPANVAIAVHPDFDYVLVEADAEKYVVARGLLDDFLGKIKAGHHKVEKTMKGWELEHLECDHPFIERHSQVIMADYVTLETGTGLVHIAPGHGHEDYISSLKYKLPILNPVDNRGRFTDEFAPMKGVSVFKANPMIIELLKEKKSLLYTENIQHSYPHCWRCKEPIIFRATHQWFISMEKHDFREQALAEIKNVKWLNEWGETRINKMVEGRPDWCISRQRVWGVPIFVFYCKDCGEPLVNEDSIAKIHEVIKKEGSDGWFIRGAHEILGENFKCRKCGKTEFEKETDIFDVWFDSGASSFAVLETHKDLSWPADLYLEGSDQYRGWFQSSLLTAVGYKGKAPYKSVISHGWVVDGQGRAMHKSLGNGVDPLKLIEKGGADLLRLWVASEDFTTDQPISDEIMARVTDSYRRIRNTFKFMLGNMDDFDKKDMVSYDNLSMLDKYALHKLQELCDRVDNYYEKFEFFNVYKDYMQFCSAFLSSFYFDILKDRLYTYKKAGIERRGAQTVICKMLIKLTKLIAPVLAFTADEVWQFMPERLRKESHIQLALWDDAAEKAIPEGDVKDWELLLQVREAVFKKIEDKRNEKIIKHPYEADVFIKYSSGELDRILKKFKNEIGEIFIVSHVNCEAADLADKDWAAGIEISVEKAVGEKCGRCWKYHETVGRVSAHPTLCERCSKNI